MQNCGRPKGECLVAVADRVPATSGNFVIAIVLIVGQADVVEFAVIPTCEDFFAR